VTFLCLAFLLFSRSRQQEKFLKNLSQNFGKIALCGVVGSEKKIRGFWKLPAAMLNDLQNGETA